MSLGEHAEAHQAGAWIWRVLLVATDRLLGTDSVTFSRGYITCHTRSMSSSDVRAKSSVDCFAWQYAFYTHLLYHKARGTAAQLLDITRVVHIMRGHRDPIRVAHETLLTWPFDTPEWGG